MHFDIRKTTADDGTGLEYYVYPKEGKDFERAIVYVHGLISDINWFRVPENLPDGTAIVFLPRQPRVHVDRFETWSRNYHVCLEHYKANHRCKYYHLLAQCFGTLPSTHWAVTKPESFDTITLACPPIELRHPFSLLKKLWILLGPRKGRVHSGLQPGTYGRTPSLKRFIEENPTTIWKLTNGFYRQANRLNAWLKRYMISFPAPTHAIIATEDKVAKTVPFQAPAGTREMANRTTLIYSDHYCELLPSRHEFWRAVFEFMLDHEGRFEIDGMIDTVLVTGATGFLGSHIVRKLHADGKHVIVYARNPDKAKRMFADLKDRLVVHQGDIHDLEAMEKALEGVDAVVHSAGFVSDWDTYESFEKVNVNGTKNILLLAHEKGVKQFVHISSLGVFGDEDQDNIDENNMYQLSSDYYSNSKIYAEIVVRKYCTINRIPFSVIRPGFIYGEGDNNFFPKLIENLKKKKAKYIGSRDNILNNVYVGNVAELVSKVLGNPESFGETYNLSDPQRITIHEFFERVCDELGLEAPTKVVPKPVALVLAAVLEEIFRKLHLKSPPPLTRKKVTFVARSRAINASKAYDLMGREPYSAEEGLSRTLESLGS